MEVGVVIRAMQIDHLPCFITVSLDAYLQLPFVDLVAHGDENIHLTGHLRAHIHIRNMILPPRLQSHRAPNADGRQYGSPVPPKGVLWFAHFSAQDPARPPIVVPPGKLSASQTLGYGFQAYQQHILFSRFDDLIHPLAPLQKRIVAFTQLDAVEPNGSIYIKPVHLQFGIVA